MGLPLVPGHSIILDDSAPPTAQLLLAECAVMALFAAVRHAWGRCRSRLKAPDSDFCGHCRWSRCGRDWLSRPSEYNPLPAFRTICGTWHPLTVSIGQVRRNLLCCLPKRRAYGGHEGMGVLALSSCHTPSGIAHALWAGRKTVPVSPRTTRLPLIAGSDRAGPGGLPACWDGHR